MVISPNSGLFRILGSVGLAVLEFSGFKGLLDPNVI